MTVVSYSAGAGDCYGLNDGTFDSGGNTLWIGNLSSNRYKAWIPFTVYLPKSLVITSAILKLIADANNSGDTCRIKVGCEAADNPSAPASWAQLDARTLSSAFLSVDPVGSTSIGVEYTYDITSAVQEILNRAGWAGGNTLAVLIHDNVSDFDRRRRFASQENATYTEPILQVTYSRFLPSGGMV